MSYFELKRLILYLFLAIFLGIGLWASKNIKSIEALALDNRRYSTGLLVISFLASWMSSKI